MFMRIHRSKRFSCLSLYHKSSIHTPNKGKKKEDKSMYVPVNVNGVEPTSTVATETKLTDPERKTESRFISPLFH